MATRRGRTQAYSAGNKVYGAGRPMPTVGPVDKTGYRERDAKHMIWKNAISQRLGAPVATAPPMAASGSNPNYGGVGGYGAPKPQVPVVQPQQPEKYGGNVNLRTATGRPSETPPAASPNPLTATPSGQMQPTKEPIPGVGGLPYDPAYADVRRAIENRRGRFMADRAQKRGNAELEAGEQKREIDQQAPDILRQLLDTFAGRGMAYSGRYATDFGDTQNEFANQKGRIDRGLAQRLAEMSSEEANYNADLDSELSDAQFDYVRAMSDRAGDLGIYQEPAAMLQPEPELQVQPQQQIQQSLPVARPDVLGRRTVENRGTAPVAATSAPVMRDVLTRPMSSFPDSAQNQLESGREVVAGNGYVYKLVNGVVKRVR